MRKFMILFSQYKSKALDWVLFLKQKFLILSKQMAEEAKVFFSQILDNVVEALFEILGNFTKSILFLLTVSVILFLFGKAVLLPILIKILGYLIKND